MMKSTGVEVSSVNEAEETLWERMVIEERRLMASQLGVKVSDLEEMDELNDTIDASRRLMNNDHEENQMIRMNDSSSIIHDTSSLGLINSVDESLNHHHHKESIDEMLHMKMEEAEEEDDYEVKDVYLNEYEEIITKPVHESNQLEQPLSIHKKYRSLHGSHEGAMILNEKKPMKGIKNHHDEGPWKYLPKEVIDRILIILCDIDMLGYLQIVSKSTFQPEESVYEALCRYIYPQQTGRLLMKVERWLNWKNMLINRPRLRTNGFYTLRTTFTKAPNNDAFWEEKQYRFIEVKYYRHMRFFNNGRMLYSLDIIEPDDMAQLLRPGKTIPKRVFEGTYTMTKREVKVKVVLHYCVMFFELLLLDGDDGYIGKHNMLHLISHYSKTHQQQENHQQQQSRVEYKLPQVKNLRFHRFWDFIS